MEQNYYLKIQIKPLEKDDEGCVDFGYQGNSFKPTKELTKAEKKQLTQEWVKKLRLKQKKELNGIIDKVLITNYLYVCTIKKPHKYFNVGDKVAGFIIDGQADRFLCWGWSTKQKRMINRFTIYYGGWKRVYESEKSNNYKVVQTKAGYLKDNKKYDLNKEMKFWEMLEHCKSNDEYLRELSKLCGSNFPKG